MNPRIASIYSIRGLAFIPANVQNNPQYLGKRGKNITFAANMQRINWIDWAKGIAVCTVVFCHLPQSQEWFYYRYLQACIITIFFFLSGYLKKDRDDSHERWRKYWHSLIVPYFLLNVLLYPYWLLRFYMKTGDLPTLFEAVRPFIGTLLMQHENSFAEPLNGPLWYLPAILLMHVIIDLLRKTRYLHTVMIGLCVLSVVLYGANKYWNIVPSLTPIGILRRLPYYYIGYVMGRQQLFRTVRPWRDLLMMTCCLLSSLVLFQWHLVENSFPLHIVLFYPVNIGFLFGVLYGCKLLNAVHWRLMTYLSIGTLVVIGLHNAPVTAVNYLLERYFHLSNTIVYQWYEAIPVTLLIIALLYPIILLSKKYFPVLMGK